MKTADDYEDVTDNYMPILGYIVVATICYELLGDFTETDRRVLDFICFLLVFTGLGFQIFRPRYCGICGAKMKKYYNGVLSVPFHYCDTCKVKVRTFVKSRTT